tara:strand:+ start:285 stop:605 length:321 start_codon:yes stop_codon:yes gene_type:complete
MNNHSNYTTQSINSEIETLEARIKDLEIIKSSTMVKENDKIDAHASILAKIIKDTNPGFKGDKEVTPESHCVEKVKEYASEKNWSDDYIYTVFNKTMVKVGTFVEA